MPPDVRKELEARVEDILQKGGVSSSGDEDDGEGSRPGSDFAVIFLNNPSAGPVIGLETMPPAAGTQADVAGWGITLGLTEAEINFPWLIEMNPSRGSPSTLRQLAQTVSDQSLCDGDTTLCATSPGKPSTIDPAYNTYAAPCSGDSGGPLFRKDGEGYRQAGVVSYGVPCGAPAQAANQDVYANVPVLLDWLKSTLARRNPLGFSYFAATPNQQAVAGALDRVRRKAKGEAARDIGGLYLNSWGGVSRSLESLLPNNALLQSQTARRIGAGQNAILSNRMALRRLGFGSGLSGSGLSSRTMKPEGLNPAEARQEAARLGDQQQKLEQWQALMGTAGIYVEGAFDRDADDSLRGQKAKGRNMRLTLGGDMDFGKGRFAGAAFSYTKGKLGNNFSRPTAKPCWRAFTAASLFWKTAISTARRMAVLSSMTWTGHCWWAMAPA